MADFAGEVVGAMIKLAVENDSRAKARAHGEEDHVFNAAAGAIAMFCHRTGVRVVLETARRRELRFQNAFDRHVHPSPQIGRCLNDSGNAIKRSAATYSDAVDVFRRMVREQLANGALDRFERGLGTLRGLCRELLAAENDRRRLRRHHSRLCSADIDADPHTIARGRSLRGPPRKAAQCAAS